MAPDHRFLCQEKNQECSRRVVTENCSPQASVFWVSEDDFLRSKNGVGNGFFENRTDFGSDNLTFKGQKEGRVRAADPQ